MRKDSRILKVTTRSDSQPGSHFLPRLLVPMASKAPDKDRPRPKPTERKRTMGLMQSIQSLELMMTRLQCSRKQRAHALRRLCQVKQTIDTSHGKGELLDIDSVVEGNKSLAELSRFLEALHEDRLREKLQDSRSSLPMLQESLTSINEDESVDG